MVECSAKIDAHDLYPIITLYGNDIDELDAWLEHSGFYRFEVYRAPPTYSADDPMYCESSYAKR